MRRHPLRRRTPLRADPQQVADWQRRSARPLPRRGPNAAWFKVREAVKRRAGGVCEIGVPGCYVTGTDAHHRLQRSLGGPDELWNLLWVCRRCHNWVDDHVAEAHERGWLLHSWDAGAA